jgi:two-component system CheB/CheR fusion protein
MQSVNEELESVNAELHAKVEEATRATTEIQNLYASSQIATVFLDTELRISRFTPAAKRLLRLIDGDVNRPIADLAPRFQGEHLVLDAAEAVRSGASFERQVRTAQDQWFIKRLLPYLSLENQVVGVSVTFVDITEVKKTEGALRQSEERFRTMADAMPQLAWTAEADGFISWYNRRWYAYTGTTPEQMEGWGWQSVHDPATLPAVLEKWKSSIATGEPFEMEFPLRAGDGQFRRFLTRVVPLRDAQGRVVQWFGTNTDISELAEAQEALREEDRRKNEFLAVLSHELRNPLTPIRNSLYVMKRTPPGGEQAQRAHAVIERQVDHMARLVDDLLDVTRITRGKINIQSERLDLAELLRRVVEDLRTILDRHTFSLEVAEEPVWVQGDRTRLSQAIGNLLNNAAKFTPAQGRIDVALAEANGEAVLEICDSGIGMEQETLQGLFSPFVQADHTLDRSKGGLGLGLALVKMLVELHHGTVSAQSEGLERGSRFTVRLPLAPRQSATQPVPAPRDGAGPGRRVLLIEDNKDAADSLSEALDSFGHQVEVAYTGESGLSKARQRRPEIVLCDIGLPGMDGYAVARAFRSQSSTASTFLVALSGYAQPEDQRRAIAAGFDVHLAKPPDLLALNQLLMHGSARVEESAPSP